MLDFDMGYSEHARRFTEESKRLREEYSKKEARRMLWLGKFAFPKVDTKKTKLLFVPSDYHRYYIPVVEPVSWEWGAIPHPFAEVKKDVIDLNKWAYDGKRWRAIIRFGYYEKDDVLIVCKEAFIYQQRHVESDGSSWWF
jgi:hypothetical protein